jgi:hypothetical protein
MAAQVLEVSKSPMWWAMKLARGLKMVRSEPRSFIRRSWLVSMDSRSSSSLIFSSAPGGLARVLERGDLQIAPGAQGGRCVVAVNVDDHRGFSS